MVIKGASYPRGRLRWPGGAFVMGRIGMRTLPPAFIAGDAKQSAAICHLQFNANARVIHITAGAALIRPRSRPLGGMRERGKQTQTRRRPSAAAASHPAAIFLRRWGKNMHQNGAKGKRDEQTPTKGGRGFCWCWSKRPERL